jgi:hypothetical protein
MLLILISLQLEYCTILLSSWNHKLSQNL